MKVEDLTGETDGLKFNRRTMGIMAAKIGGWWTF